MKNTMFKSTLREIKGSFGRWIAILGIVALGVGFFSGLKVCKSAFFETADTYLNKHNFFDYQLISTLGLESEDVETIASLPQVADAQGSYSADVLVEEDHSDTGEFAAKFLTISDRINTPSLKAGKLPKNSDECLGDARYFTEDDIGRQINISASNDSDTLDMLAFDSYTITGIADSPLYLNFERGSSSVGDGTTACFIMIPEDGFSSEIFTEMYVKLAESAYIFSDEYEDISEEALKPLETAMEQVSERRYNSIIDEARTKLDDAKEELAKGEAELKDAKAKLVSSESDIADGEAEIKKNKANIDDAQIAIDKGFAEYKANLDKYNSEKDNAYKQLEAAYNGGMLTEEQYQASKVMLDDQFSAARSELEAARQKLDDGQAEIVAGLAELEKAKTRLENGRQEIRNGYKELADGEAELKDARIKVADAEKEINKIEYPDNYVLDRDTNVGYVCFRNDTSIIEGIAKVFPAFFFLVAALVCMTTMSRMIEEQRTQIGVLKALGYSVPQILGKYIFYSGSSALIGGILGFFAGTYIFTFVIWEAYKIMYEFSDVIFVFDWVTGGLALLAALVCSVGTTLYTCWHELNQVPAQLIRPKAPSAGKRILLERVPFVWNRLKFLQKVSIRNVFRYKKRFFMMIVGICGCTALLVTGFGIRDSIKNVVSMQYDEIFHVDYEVTFNHGLNQDEQDLFLEENADYIDKNLFLHTGAAETRIDGQIKPVNLVVCDEDSSIEKFIDLHNEGGHIKYPSVGEGVINSNLAENLGIKVGGEITVYDSDMRPLTVKVSALCDNYVYNYLYINPETFEKAWGEPEINAAYILGDDGADSHIMNSSNVSAVSVTEDFRNRIDNMMASLDYVIALIIAAAAALAFIVLYNLTNINITERIREIATIKVLGFYPRETSSYVFRENIALTAIAAVVGIPLGKWLHGFVMSQIQIDMLSFDVHITILSYLLSIVGTFVFAAIVNMTMRHKIDKISMTESLKSIE